MLSTVCCRYEEYLTNSCPTDTIHTLAAEAATAAEELFATAPNQEAPTADRSGIIGDLGWVTPVGALPMKFTTVPSFTILTAMNDFCSAVASVALYQGKWLFEITLNSERLMQVGLCVSPRCATWTKQNGVGDFPFSFGLDGFRHCVWNVTPTACNCHWMMGDTITFLVDLDNGNIEFLQNGQSVSKRSFPTAMTTRDPLLAFAPALSLSAGESCIVNLGRCTFRYPRDGFNPVEPRADSKPWSALFSGLLSIAKASARVVGNRIVHGSALVVASSLLQRLACSQTLRDLEGPVIALLESLLAACEQDLVLPMYTMICGSLPKKLNEALWTTLVAAAAFSSFAEVPVEPFCGPTSNAHLKLAHALCREPSLVRMWVSSKAFLPSFLSLMRFRGLSPRDLERVFPTVPLDSDNGMDALELNTRVAMLREASCVSARLRSEIFCCCAKEPATSAVWTDYARRLVAEVRSRASLADNGVACGMFPVMLRSCIDLARSSGSSMRDVVMAFCPEPMLAQPLVGEMEVDRIGGDFRLLSRASSLKVESPASTAPPFNPMLIQASMLFHYRVLGRLTECSGHVARKRQEREALAQGDVEDIDRLIESLSLSIRVCAWEKATFVTPYLVDVAQDAVLLLCDILRHYEKRVAFEYLPVTMLELYFELLRFLRKSSDAFPEFLKEHGEILHFVANRAMDSQTRLHEVSEYMISSLSALFGSNELVRAAVASCMDNWTMTERMSFVAKVFVKFSHSLTWTSVVSLIGNFNVGNGFCSSVLETDRVDGDSFLMPFSSSPTSFVYFRELLRVYLDSGWSTGVQGFTADDTAAASPSGIVKALVDHTNWAVSELAAAMSEVCQMNHPPTAQDQGKVIYLFEVTRRLLMIVEFVIEAAPKSFFTSAEGAMHTKLITEIFAQCLSRFAPGEHLVKALKLCAVRKCQPHSLFARVLGVVFSMCQGGKSLNIAENPFLKELSGSTAQWQAEQLEFLLHAADWQEIESGCGCVPKVAQFVGNGDIWRCFRDACAAHSRGASLAEEDTGIVDESTCPICTVQAIDTVFLPCQHKSCRVCIQRHMLHHKTCFFCHAVVTELKDSPPKK